MKPLTRDDLYSLEAYADARADFRHRVIEHKKHRQVRLHPNAALYFEDRLTIQYQIQEMLRVERIFERAAIQEELDAYNPLIPDGSNWKATFMLEYPDVDERRRELARLGGIEHKVWVQVEGCGRIRAIANEDMERTTDDKTAAVHFMRFELDAVSIAALRTGSALHMGIEHPGLPCDIAVPEVTRQALLHDLADHVA
ncbi:MAG: DUF3501 family protein [Pseudomonadales bacterium]